MHTGKALESTDIDPEQWSNLISGTNELGRVLYEEFGVELVFHPARRHPTSTPRIGSRSSSTTPTPSSSICAWTPGHIAYCGGDNLQIIEARSGTDHLRTFQVGGSKSPRAGAAGRSCRWPKRLPLGIMVEPPYGEPQVPPLLESARRVGTATLFTVIEQDLYPIAGAPSRWPSRPGRPGVLHRPGPGPCAALAVLSY